MKKAVDYINKLYKNIDAKYECEMFTIHNKIFDKYISFSIVGTEREVLESLSCPIIKKRFDNFNQSKLPNWVIYK